MTQPTDHVLTEQHARLLAIIIENIWFAEAHPDVVAEAAKRNNVPPQSALACAIAEQINDEFTLVLR
jgi:hypothetical protein